MVYYKKFLSLSLIITLLLSQLQFAGVQAYQENLVESEKTKQIRQLDGVESVLDNAIKKLDKNIKNKQKKEQLQQKQEEIKEILKESK